MTDPASELPSALPPERAAAIVPRPAALRPARLPRRLCGAGDRERLAALGARPLHRRRRFERVPVAHVGPSVALGGLRGPGLVATASVRHVAVILGHGGALPDARSRRLPSLRISGHTLRPPSGQPIDIDSRNAALGDPVEHRDAPPLAPARPRRARRRPPCFPASRRGTQHRLRHGGQRTRLPAADVEVVLRPYPSEYQVDLFLLGQADALPEASDHSRSGPDGSYSLSAPRSGPYLLEFRPPAAGAEPRLASPLVYGSLVPLKGPQIAETIELPQLHLVAVRVLDTARKPVEGAQVVADPTVWVSPSYLRRLTRQFRDLQTGNYSRPREQQILPAFYRSVARTDAEGIARFRLPTEDAILVVSAPGFVRGEGKSVSGRASCRLERDPGVQLRVRAPDGTSAPGVLVRTPDATGDFRGRRFLPRKRGRLRPRLPSDRSGDRLREHVPRSAAAGTRCGERTGPSRADGGPLVRATG